jgi:hypothetical protein
MTVFIVWSILFNNVAEIEYLLSASISNAPKKVKKQKISSEREEIAIHSLPLQRIFVLKSTTFAARKKYIWG